MNQYIAMALAAYLLIGLIASFVGPCATGLRNELRDVRATPGVSPLKIAAFWALLASAIVVAWPVLVPSAYRSARKPMSLLDALQGLPEFQAQNELYSVLKEEASLEPTEDGVLPGASGAFGASPQNPIPVRTIFASTSYLARVTTLAGEKVNYRRIGSFESMITDKMVDGYRLTSPQGEELGTIFLSPYCTLTSMRPPAGFAFAGEGVSIDCAGTANDAEPPPPPVPDTSQPSEKLSRKPVDAKKLADRDRFVLFALRSAAEKKQDYASVFAVGERLMDRRFATFDPDEGEVWLRRAELLKHSCSSPSWVNPKAEFDGVRVAGRHRNDRPGFEYAVSSALEDKLDVRLFVLGVRRGNACLKRALEIMANDRLLRRLDIGENATGEDVARLVADRRGYFDVGSESGMTNILDGADPLFDRRRAVFFLGVEKGIEGANPDELADEVKAGFSQNI